MAFLKRIIKKRPSKLGTSAKIAIAASVVAFFLVAGATLMVAYQIGTGTIDNPRFCGTCHIMIPFVNKWETSVHGQTFVKCHQCHESGTGAVVMAVRYPLGMYQSPVNISFPSDRIDEICSNCHVRSGLHNVKAHATATCSDCHGLHGPGIETPSSADCQKCHGNLPKYMMRVNCYRCHTRDDWGAPIGHIVTDKGLDFETCTKCHVVSGLHEDHSSKVECSTCHTKGGFRGIIPVEDTCYTCHKDQLERFPGQLCSECHTRHEWGGRKVT